MRLALTVIIFSRKKLRLNNNRASKQVMSLALGSPLLLFFWARLGSSLQKALLSSWCFVEQSESCVGSNGRMPSIFTALGGLVAIGGVEFRGGEINSHLHLYCWSKEAANQLHYNLCFTISYQVAIGFLI
jgi:hypothetical protein